MELELLGLFQAARGANATLILAVVIGIWIAARFASVAMQNNVPLFGKIVITVFALAGFLFGWQVFTTAANNFTITSNAMLALEESGEAISPIAKGFIEYFPAGELSASPPIIGIFYLVAGLLIAVVPLWLDRK